LMFLRSMADFGTPYIVGGKFNTLATASYTQLIGTYNMEMASTLNVVLLFFCLIAFGLYSRAQRTGGGVQMQTESGQRKALNLSRPVKAVLWTVSSLFSIIILLLVVSVFLAVFTKHLGSDFTFTLEHFDILPQRGWNSTRNTLVFATITSVIMSAAGIVVAYFVTRVEFRGKGVLDSLATLPFAIPGTFMGVGYALAFSRPPLVLSGTWAIIVACTVIRELPLGLRAGVSVLTQQDRSIEDASANLGASRVTTFLRIVVPLARPALLVSALYAFVSTVKTLGAIIFLITPSNKVLAADVFESAVRDDVGDAAALSMVVVLVSALGVLGIYAISKREATQTWFRKILTRTPG
jgi:iron(III) transport system permease protein